MFRACPVGGERTGNQLILDVPEERHVLIQNLIGTSRIRRTLSARLIILRFHFNDA